MRYSLLKKELTLTESHQVRERDLKRLANQALRMTQSKADMDATTRGLKEVFAKKKLPRRLYRRGSPEGPSLERGQSAMYEGCYFRGVPTLRVASISPDTTSLAFSWVTSTRPESFTASKASVLPSRYSMQ